MPLALAPKRMPSRWLELRRLAPLALLGATLLTGAPALAQDDSETPKRLSITGHVELDFESEHNFNLDRSTEEDFTVIEPELRTHIAFVPSPFFQFVGRFRLRRKLDLHYEDKKKDREWVLEMEQLYVMSQTRDTRQRLFVGRTRFRDNREWLYDMNLDGVRGLFTLPGVRMELSMTRLNYYSDDLFHENLDDPIANIHVYATAALPKDGFISAYWLAQDDRSTGDEQLHYVGLRSGAEPRKGLVYYAELMHVTGDIDGEAVSGTGFDVGLHYELPGKLRPYPFIGYAFGTGDDNPDDQKNKTFRQTGYQDNNGRLGGVIRYKFYGELFEPMLSNMGIVTAGVGVRPWKRISMDVVYHRYVQHHAADEIRDTNIDADPDGVHPHLGQELDFVIGFRQIKNLRVKGALGWFFPGSAFDPMADHALFAGLELRYYY